MPCCPPHSTSRDPRFRPNYTLKALTLKFYARHDQANTEPQYMAHVKDYEREIEKRRQIYSGKTLAPLTENQSYGWLADKAERYGEDSVHDHKRLVDAMLKEHMKIQSEMRRQTYLYRM